MSNVAINPTTAPAYDGEHIEEAVFDYDFTTDLAETEFTTSFRASVSKTKSINPFPLNVPQNVIRVTSEKNHYFVYVSNEGLEKGDTLYVALDVETNSGRTLPYAFNAVDVE